MCIKVSMCSSQSLREVLHLGGVRFVNPATGIWCEAMEFKRGVQMKCDGDGIDVNWYSTYTQWYLDGIDLAWMKLIWLDYVVLEW